MVETVCSQGTCFFLNIFFITQILHELPLNIKILSPKVSDIQRREAKLNIISPRGNTFDTQQKSMQYLLYYILLFGKNEQNEKISVQFKCRIFIFSLMYFFNNVKFLFVQSVAGGFPN